MQSQCQRPVLILVAERELHLIAVCKFFRTCLHSFKKIFTIHGFIQNVFHLFCLHFHLCFIRHSLVHTPSACRENAAHRFSCFQRRFLQHFQQAPLCISSLKLIHTKFYLLSRNPVLYDHRFTFFCNCDNSFIGKFHFFYRSF